MKPKVADEDDETLTLLPLEHMLVGQHYTPLGLRLTRQLFLVFDQDGDDRLSAEELHMLNLVRHCPHAATTLSSSPAPQKALLKRLSPFDQATSEPGEELDDEMTQQL